MICVNLVFWCSLPDPTVQLSKPARVGDVMCWILFEVVSLTLRWGHILLASVQKPFRVSPESSAKLFCFLSRPMLLQLLWIALPRVNPSFSLTSILPSTWAFSVHLHPPVSVISKVIRPRCATSYQPAFTPDKWLIGCHCWKRKVNRQQIKP